MNGDEVMNETAAIREIEAMNMTEEVNVIGAIREIEAMNMTEEVNVIEAIREIESMIMTEEVNVIGAMSSIEIAARAKSQLSALTGLNASTISRLSHDVDGWHIVADMIELKRIPESSDVLATYEVQLDETGNLLSYRRTQRYIRGQISN